MIDTTSEMVAGYTVAALLYGGYLLSLWVRSRRVAARVAALSPAHAARGANSSRVSP